MIALAEHAPYDRVIARCSVPYVPQRCWIKRSRVLVLPMRSGERSGHQWIARYSRAEGRLIAGARLPGGFIPLTPVPFRP
jgi:protein-L-isoaspartate O-methyltransferase